MENARVRTVAVLAASLVAAAGTARAEPTRAEPVSSEVAPGPAAALPPAMLQGTPLVLKDGRMAYVSVQSVPFEAGSDDLAPSVAAALSRLAGEIATDCFLTAQAIGHVEPGAQGEGGDTLASHRLSRARAERVQRALAGKGLPASAVAGVWDWQFLVREPRVTLWVFRMREGEDCKGAPLPAGKAAALIAKADQAPADAGRPSAKPKPPVESRPPAAARADGPAAASPAAPAVLIRPSPDPRLRPGAVVAARGEAGSPASDAGAPVAATAPVPPAAGPPEGGAGDGADALVGRTTAAVAARPAAEKRPRAEQKAAEVESEAGAEAEAEPSGPSTTQVVAATSAANAVTRARQAPKPAPAPAAATAAAAASVPDAEVTTAERAQAPAAAPEAAPVQVAAVRPARERAGGARPPRLEIVFDNNSSYLPSGAAGELKRWLAALPPGRGYELRLAAAVAGGGTSGSAGTDGPRYERWLAERRLGRLGEWLERNARAVPNLTVSRSYLERDASRRVVVEARPLP